MTLENHSLINEFPEMRDLIHQLKTSDSHFAKIFAEYDEIVHVVHRIESGAEAAVDERLEGLKKNRLRLKDELFAILKKSAA
ncbi:MAG: YdcH family protein [Alphaproteobacteria bacterium]